MLLVVILAAGLWGLGAMTRLPLAMRGVMIGMLWVGVILLHVVLPNGHALREATGGSAALWLILGAAGVMALCYGKGISWLKVRAVRQGDPGENVQDGTSFSATEIERYARHIVLREIGGPGQKKLKTARVLVVGAGGLGAPVLTYLTAAGVGTIGVIDHDEVSNSNLQRQVIFRDHNIGKPKVFAAEEALRALNPFVTIRPYHRRLEAEIAADLFADYDLVLDGTDNFETRYVINRAAVATDRPLISGAISQWEGQISVFDPNNGAPCYQCIFPKEPAEGLAPSCAEAGVMGPLPGVIGAMMAGEAIKLITGAGAPLRGEMLIYDALYGESRKFTLSRRADCPICAENAQKGTPED